MGSNRTQCKLPQSVDSPAAAIPRQSKFLSKIQIQFVTATTMFVITEIRDNVQIRAASKDKMATVEGHLNKKYLNKLVQDLGLVKSINSISLSKDFKICSHMLLATVRCELLFYRFYPDEICTGKIVSQDPDGLILENFVFGNFRVLASDLFDNCQYGSGQGGDKWIWSYCESRLCFSDGDTVRFRIRQYNAKHGIVFACMNEQGLGPVLWWD